MTGCPLTATGMARTRRTCSGRSSDCRRAVRRRIRRPGQRLAGDPGRTGLLGRHRDASLATLVGEVELLLEPVAKELVVVRPIGFEPLHWVRALAAEDPVPSDKHLTSAAVSVPGVLLTQMAAVRALARQGMDLVATPPVAVAGHSQGVLGCRGAEGRAAPATSSCWPWRS